MRSGSTYQSFRGATARWRTRNDRAYDSTSNSLNSLKMGRIDRKSTLPSVLDRALFSAVAHGASRHTQRRERFPRGTKQSVNGTLSYQSQLHSGWLVARRERDRRGRLDVFGEVRGIPRHPGKPARAPSIEPR